VAWVAHGLLSVLIAQATCPEGVPDSARRWLALLTLAALVLAVVGGVVTYLNWRRLAEQPRVTRAEGRGREEFLALGGIFISVVFIIALIWGGLPLVLLDVCEAFL
jgi:hypothetical protein